jgi:integrase/recombinase XerD
MERRDIIKSLGVAAAAGMVSAASPLSARSYLKSIGSGDRTIYDRLKVINIFLKAHGVTGVSLRHDYNKTIPPISYRTDELQTLFGAATVDELALFQFFLCSGAREGEVQHAEWTGIDYAGGVFNIVARNGWRTKGRKDRTVPLPTALLEVLKQRQATSTSTYIFHGRDGGINHHYLDTLKGLAKRAGLNPQDFILHRFRKTYATNLHQDGVDIRTIQSRLGHASINTTLLYLGIQDPRSDKSRDQVNRTFSQFFLAKAA